MANASEVSQAFADGVAACADRSQLTAWTLQVLSSAAPESPAVVEALGHVAACQAKVRGRFVAGVITLSLMADPGSELRRYWPILGGDMPVSVDHLRTPLLRHVTSRRRALAKIAVSDVVLCDPFAGNVLWAALEKDPPPANSALVDVGGGAGLELARPVDLSRNLSEAANTYFLHVVDPHARDVTHPADVVALRAGVFPDDIDAIREVNRRMGEVAERKPEIHRCTIREAAACAHSGHLLTLLSSRLFCSVDDPQQTLDDGLALPNVREWLIYEASPVVEDLLGVGPLDSEPQMALLRVTPDRRHEVLSLHPL